MSEDDSTNICVLHSPSVSNFVTTANTSQVPETKRQASLFLGEIVKLVDSTDIHAEGDKKIEELGLLGQLKPTCEEYKTGLSSILQAVYNKMANASGRISLSWMTAFGTLITTIDDCFIRDMGIDLIPLAANLLSLFQVQVDTAGETDYMRLFKLLNSAYLILDRVQSLGHHAMDFNREGMYRKLRRSCREVKMMDIWFPFRYMAYLIKLILRKLEKKESKTEKAKRVIGQTFSVCYGVFVAANSISIRVPPQIDDEGIARGCRRIKAARNLRIKKTMCRTWIDELIECAKEVKDDHLKFDEFWTKAESTIWKVALGGSINRISLRYSIIYLLSSIAETTKSEEVWEKAAKKLIEVAKLCLDENGWGWDRELTLAALNALNSLRQEPLIFDESGAQVSLITALEKSIVEWENEGLFSERMRSAAAAREAQEESCHLLMYAIPAAGLVPPSLDAFFNSQLRKRCTRCFPSRPAYHPESRVPIQLTNHNTRVVGSHAMPGRKISMKNLFTYIGDTGSSSSPSMRISSSSVSPKRICIGVTPVQAKTLLGKNLMNSWAKGEIWADMETVYYVRKEDIRSNKQLASIVAECCYSGIDRSQIENLEKHVKGKLKRADTLVIVDITDETVRIEDDILYDRLKEGHQHNLLLIYPTNSSSMANINFDLKVSFRVCLAASYSDWQVECGGLSNQESNNLIEQILGDDQGQAFKEWIREIDDGAELKKCPLALPLLCKKWIARPEESRATWPQDLILKSVIDEMLRVFGNDHAMDIVTEGKVLSSLETIAIRLGAEEGRRGWGSRGRLMDVDFLQTNEIHPEMQRVLLTCGFLVRSEIDGYFSFPSDCIKFYFCGLCMFHALSNGNM